MTQQIYNSIATNYMRETGKHFAGKTAKEMQAELDALCTKRVDWACPTSPLAEKLRFWQTGCFTVGVLNKDWESTELIGFKELGAAKDYAKALPYTWNELTY